MGTFQLLKSYERKEQGGMVLKEVYKGLVYLKWGEPYEYEIC